MNVATIKLCKELYELSGWESEKTWAYTNDDEQGYLVDSDSSNLGHDIYRVAYAYDLGYLLRKLPHVINENEHRGDYFVLEPITADKWAASYGNRTSDEWADTPEDAACKLAIELFKQGILTKA